MALRASVCAVSVFVAAQLSACNARAPEPRETLTHAEAISADGAVIDYEVRGTRDPTIVLIHGWTNSRGIWGVHPRTLSTTNRVVALDLAGHGVSGDDRTDWTISAFGEDVAAVVDDLELEEVVLVGFSMGAPVALEAAGLLGARVLGVVVVDALHDIESYPALDSAAHEEWKAAVRASWRDPAAVRAFAFTPDAPDSLIRYVADMMPPEPREIWFDISRATDEWVLSDRIAAIQRLRVPIAAINTTNVPTNVDAVRAYAPSFRVDTMEGLGHAGILLRRVDDFDARLRAIVAGFQAAEKIEAG